MNVERNGDKFWYQNNELHREDGPAVEYQNGNERWYLNGKLHRLNGPAIKYQEEKYWYIYGKIYTEEKYNTKIFQTELNRDLFKIC